jgi:hypothetical protein
MIDSSPASVPFSFTRRAAAALVLTLGTATACQAHAETPHAVQPSLEVEIDDRGPDKSDHVSRVVLGFVNGEAKIETTDGPARYEVEAKSVRDPAPIVQLGLRRSQSDRSRDLNVRTSFVLKGNERVMVTKVDGADGHSTTVTARLL